MTGGSHRAARARSGRERRRRSATGFLLVAVLLAACGGTAGESAGPTPPVASEPASSPAATPRWPGSLVDAVIALGAMDEQLLRASSDLTAAADAQDPQGMWGAADGLLEILDPIERNTDVLAGRDETMALATQYRAALDLIRQGATDIRDGFAAGDARRIESGSQTLSRGFVSYGDLRATLATLVEQAILQKRLLLK